MNLLDIQNMAFSGWDTSSQLRDHIYRRSREAFARGARERAAIADPAALAQRREAARTAFLECIGGLPSAPAELEAETIGTVRVPGLIIEKIIFQSRPRHYVTANLYLPEHRIEPSPAVLFLCGHHEAAKAAGEYQMVCRILAAAGLVVLAVDPIGQGERMSYLDPLTGGQAVTWGTREHDYAGLQCLWAGHSLARYFLHDAMRAFDYLGARPEVDAGRIGVTGNSGGGTQTCMMMLADPRIAAAAPATFLMSREAYLPTGQAQDAEQIWPGFSRAGFDHEDILITMTPRPVCVLGVEYDFFPIEGTRQTVENSRRFYEITGHADRLQLKVHPCTHRYTEAMAGDAASFFRRVLNVEAPEADIDLQPLPVAELNCTRSGQVGREYADACFAHDANREVVEARQQELAKLPTPERRNKLRTWLEETVRRDRTPGPLRFRLNDPMAVSGWHIRPVYWWSQEDLINHGLLIRDVGHAGLDLPLTIAVWAEGTRSLTEHLSWLRAETGAGRAVLVLDLSGSGVVRAAPINPYPYHELYGTLDRLNDDLVWLGDSLAGLRTFDVLRAIDLAGDLPGIDPSKVRLFGSGRHGLYARLASVLDSRVTACQCEGTPESLLAQATERFYDTYDIHGLLLPGFLARGDLPDLDARPVKASHSATAESENPSMPDPGTHETPVYQVKTL